MPSRIAAVLKAKGGHTKYQNGALKNDRIIGNAKTSLKRANFTFFKKINNMSIEKQLMRLTKLIKKKSTILL